MRQANDFSIKSPSDENAERRYLLFKGKDTGICIHGERVTLQYEVSRGYLIATDQDSYDGVGNWFYLISPDLQVLDVVGPPDSYGFIQNVTLANAEQISFSFFGSGNKWALSVLPEPVFSFSRGHLRCRLNRYLFSSSRYLQLTSMAAH